jgi:deoxycytidylate deaminase
MKKSDPRILAIDLLDRSICLVRVAAVIFDNHGIFSWGWNSIGPTGYGTHAEIHALERANRKRLHGASIAIAGRRRGRVVPSWPCSDCWDRLNKARIRRIYTQNRSGVWVKT